MMREQNVKSAYYVVKPRGSRYCVYQVGTGYQWCVGSFERHAEAQAFMALIRKRKAANRTLIAPTY